VAFAARAPSPQQETRHAITALTAAGALALTGCLVQGRDYELRGDVAVLSPQITNELVARYHRCGGNWACTTDAFYRWNFHEQHFFDNYTVSVSFRAHEGRMGFVAPALDAAAANGDCLALPANPYRAWTTAPC
jgi:hypothetical protein